jgi:type I restriction enzyme M protein
MTQASDYNLKNIKDQFKRDGVFYTPPELAEWLKGLIPEKPKRVYDPTCGRGALLSVFDDDVLKYGQDIDGNAVSDAGKYLTNFNGAVGNVLSDSKFLGEKFEAIVANPPFSVEWEPVTDGYFAEAPTVPTKGRADFAFIIHILHMLSNDGTAVVLNFPGIAYRGGREQVLRKWLIDRNVVEQVYHVGGDTFTDTKIATFCLVLKKNRTSDTVLFVDRENKLQRDVSIDEIVKADYLLSVGTYIQPVREEVKYDPVELERLARRNTIRKLKAELSFSHMVAKMEQWDFSEFLFELRKTINDFEKDNSND